MDKASLFPPKVAWEFRQAAEWEESSLLAELTEAERELLSSSATPKRTAEFALGRECGRAALRQLGAWPAGTPKPAILRREGAPVWPAGIVGSIAHSHGAAAAAVARVGDMRNVGIDLEPLDRDVTRTARRTLRPEEREALSGKSPVLALLAFCVKEAVFKALHPLTGIYLGFQDARVYPPEAPPDPKHTGTGTLEWELLKACGAGLPAGYRGTAGWSTQGGGYPHPWLLAGVWIAA